MKVAFVSIGDELLIGQTLNTNAAWLGEVFSARGFDVEICLTVGDEEREISEGVDLALKSAEVVVVTGGLGPTKDDITKSVLTNYFQTQLVYNEEVMSHVRSFFEKRGREMTENNISQAWLPESAKILKNELGTAPGMWFEHKGKVLLSLPGVPYELKHLLSDELLDQLQKRFSIKALIHKTIHVQGIGESFLADRISDLEDDLRQAGMGLAYLPSPGLIRLRITGFDSIEHQEKTNYFVAELLRRMPHRVIDTALDLSAFVGELLRSSLKSLSTSESCTGGALAAEIVRIPGSSDYFYGSVVAYANEAKTKLLAVDPEVIAKHGAVSQPVVEQMARECRRILQTNYSLAASGIAGPNGETDKYPVGTVWIALATPEKVLSRKFQFGTDRERNIRMTVLSALNMLRCELSGILDEKS